MVREQRGCWAIASSNLAPSRCRHSKEQSVRALSAVGSARIVALAHEFLLDD
ncbi:MAG: hypothetical protein KME47_17535 [Nodosilinea sp. WJT8-NPBG4]|nr:hypothetical protein [Nodosilinea sp. WJT8-NPBG4]